MSKKTFTGGLNSLLGEQPTAQQPKKKVGRPQTSTKVVKKSTGEGTKEGENRYTFILKDELVDKTKAMAYWERLMIKDVVNSALEEAVVKYEKKNGSIKPIPKTK